MGFQAETSRRTFLKAASATSATAFSSSRVLGANDRLRVGLVGCGGRGKSVMSVFQKNPAVEVIALCDVWGDRSDEARLKAPGAAAFSDHRKLLESKDLDIVLIATPDHWHAAIAIDALNAGKDVYVEKPLTLRIEEGPLVVKAARVNRRICQVGMQQRSGPHYLRARDEYFRTGKLGKVLLVRTWWHGNAAHLRKAPDALRNKPANLDWNRYLGSAGWRDWDPQQFYNFRAFLDFGGGQVTDLFTHWIDVAHMLMEQDMPCSAVASGGVYFYKDGRTAPDTINVLLGYPGEWTATFEGTLAPGVTGSAVEFCGTQGRLMIDRLGFEFFPLDTKAPSVVIKSDAHLETAHVGNFLDCVRSRQLPNGDVLVGHRSAQASHLGNLAYVQQRRLRFDGLREEILPG